MASGIQTLRTIERSIADLRQQEQALLGELEASNAEHVKILEQRAQAFRELAEVRTRHALADGVIDRADQLQHKVESALLARQRTIAALKARDTEAEGRRARHTATVEDVRRTIEELERRLDEAAATAKRQLADEASYLKLKEALSTATETFERADQKTKRAEADYTQKGKAYEDDPLFMYLWNRKYGSSEYRAGRLARIGDDYVAQLVRYHDARANYSILGEIPVRLRAHCDGLAKEAETARSRVDAVEAERVRAVAGADLIGLITEARTRQRKAHHDIEAVEAEISEVAGQLQRYGEGLDDSLQEAIELAADFLEQESFQRLLALARDTEAPTDDQIVGRIGELDRRAEQIKKENGERRRELDTIARRRKELMDVAQRFRRNHYDEPGSVLGPDDALENLLKEFLRGAITAADYWARTRRRHGWDERPADPFRRGSGLPPFGGGWGGGGGSRDDGDDFRTGGSF